MKHLSESELRARLRIITDGNHFKVQRRCLWFWRDTNESATYIGLYGGGAYDYTQTEAEETLEMLVQEALKAQQKRPWKVIE